MAHLQSRTYAGSQKVYDVATSTHNFYARSGNGAAYALVHNSHRLSVQALDALLKPMEDTVPGTNGDKRLVCIFCTTEPEKMRATIISRSIPFKIETVSVEDIAARLETICIAEGFAYEQSALPLIAQMADSHIRDALKILEGAASMGKVGEAETRKYLQMETNTDIVDLLVALGSDLDKMLALAENLVQQIAPATLYARLADASLAAYKMSLGLGKPPVHWGKDDIDRLVSTHGAGTLGIVDVFAGRPLRTSAATFVCDLVKLHYAAAAGELNPGEFDLDTRKLALGSSAGHVKGKDAKQVSANLPSGGTVPQVHKRTVNADGVSIDPRAVGKFDAPEQTAKPFNADLPEQLSPEDFSKLLLRRVKERRAGDGQKGPTTLGST